MADRTERDLHGTHDDRSAAQARRRGGRARLLAAAILTMALVGALVPLSALGASGLGAVTYQQTATATRGTATVAATATRPTATATVAGTAVRTATVAPTGVGGQPATVTRVVTPTVAATPTRPASPTATAAVPAAPRAGGGGLFQSASLAWPLAIGLTLLIAAGAAFAGYRRRVS